MVSEIGEGAFGRVYLGTCDTSVLPDIDDDIAFQTPLTSASSSPSTVFVALKIVKGARPFIGQTYDGAATVLEDGRRADGGVLEPKDTGGIDGEEAGLGEVGWKAASDFEREAELLAGLRHRNIVRFYGMSNDAEPQMLVLEYMENGDLNNYLRSAMDSLFQALGSSPTDSQ